VNVIIMVSLNFAMKMYPSLQTIHCVNLGHSQH